MENGISAKSEICTSEPDPIDFSTRKKVLYFLIGNAIPSLLLMLSARNHSLRVTWQSERFLDYAALLLSAKCGWVFYPLYIYAIGCFTVGALRPRRACHSRVVLFGVFTGVLLSLQTCFLFAAVIMQIEKFNWNSVLKIGIGLPLWGLVAIGSPLLVWLVARWIYPDVHKAKGTLWFAVLCMFGGPVLAIFLGMYQDWSIALILIPAVAVGLGGPFWMLTAYSKLSIELMRLRETRLQYKLADLLGIFAWLGGYLAAWRFAIELTVETYAQLPTSPPSNCYVATAAARGHECVVRSFSTRCINGELRLVNSQLQFLKCGELILQVLFPRLHRILRQVYDRCGPLFANCLIGPFAADFAYAMLKPAEWSVRVLLRLFFPGLNQVARRLYRD